MNLYDERIEQYIVKFDCRRFLQRESYSAEKNIWGIVTQNCWFRVSSGCRKNNGSQHNFQCVEFAEFTTARRRRNCQRECMCSISNDFKRMICEAYVCFCVFCLVYVLKYILLSEKNDQVKLNDQSI